MALTTIDWGLLELVELWSKTEPSERVSFTFPISAETGAPASSVAYAEIAPGGGIPFALRQRERVRLDSGGRARVRARRRGEDERTRRADPDPGGSKAPGLESERYPGALVFFFDSARDMVTFDEPLMPMDAAILGGD